MSTSRNARRFFSMTSAASLAGFVLTAAPSAMALCPEADPGLLPYTSAHAPQKVCTDADLQMLDTASQNPTATWADLENAVKAQNAACASCIFAKEDDASWAPIVYVGDQGGAFVNWGSCFEKAPGGSAACGQALEGADLCSTIRCSEGQGYCATQQDLDACYSTVANDPSSCGGYDYVTACGTALNDLYDNQCADFFKVIGVLCGGSLPVQPPPDAGTGTTDDAGTGSTTDAGTKPPPKPKADAGTKKDASSDDEGDDDTDPTPTKDAGKSSSGKKDAGGNNAEDDAATGNGDSGCAQSGSSPTGSLATALVAMIAIGGALRNRRRTR